MNSSGDSTNKPAQKTNQNIQVYVRVRPTNTREKLIRSNEVVEVQGARDVIAKQMLDSRTTKKFTFDRAFGMDSQQHEVYASVVSPMIDEVLAGYNCTVFAYGQTGTGKTYTMVGEEQPTLTSTQEDASNVGIIPRALNHLFDELRMMEVEFSMRVSYLELYNEELCDLLSTDDSAKIRIFDDVNKKGSVIVQGLEEIPVRCKSDVYRLLAKGQERRRTAATLMNAQSSRSHTVFSILVHIKEIGNDDEEMLKIGKLNLVDLAGSENISKAGNEKGIRTRESVNINQSLLTLGRVITALVERTPHIPYRESKLTRLLQESLGGRTKTSIIATVSPGHKDLEETLSTLDYAHRAKHIQNKPEINQRLTKKVVLKEYTEEIDRLKRDLNAAREKNGIYLASDTYNDMLYKMETQQKELNEKIHVFKSLKEEIADKTKMFEDCQRNLEDVSSTLIIEQGKVRITEAELSKTKRNLRKTERQHEESKHLVSCHQKTEKLLTDHAKQLLDVVEEASGDTKGLLASIDRRKDVEEKAVTETDLLLRNLTNNIVEVQYEMESLKKKHNQSTAMIVSDLEINTRANKEFTRTVITSLTELKTVRNDSDDRVQKMIAEWKTKTGDDSKVESEKLTALLKAMEQQQAAFFAGIKEKVSAMELTLKKESSENESMRAQLLEKINFQNAEIDKFCVELKDKISGHCSDFSRVSSQMKQKTAAQKEKFRAIQRMMLEVQQRLNAEVEDEYEPILNEFDEINSKLMAVESSSIKPFSENNSLILGEKMGCLKNVEDSHAEMSEKLAQLFTGTAEVVNDDDVVTKAKLKEAVDLVATSEGQLKARLDAIHSSVVAEFEAAAETQAAKDEAVTDLIKNEGARSLVKATEVKSMVEQTLSGYVNTAEAGITGKLSSCTGDIARFEDQDVLKYKSSGDTPARKDYKCNKNLVATSPHQRIIKRFRMERNFSESQLDSSILEVGEPSENIANSTPLRTQTQTQNNIGSTYMLKETVGDFGEKGLKDLEISKVIAEGKENLGGSLVEEV